MAASLLDVDRSEPGVVLVRLNRPEARNALSVGLREEATTLFRELGTDESVCAIILTGAGKAFSAGVDLKELSQPGGAPRPSSRGAAELGEAIVACPVPVIAAVNGVAITGGFELALACDIIVASSDARFADTHARVGILPAWGLTQRLPRLIGMSRAKQLSFTGNFLDAATAERWGLVNEVCEPDRLIERAVEIASEIASCDRRAVRNLKRVYDEGALVTMGAGLELEIAANRAHMTAVRPEDIAAKREEVQARGRQQTSG